MSLLENIVYKKTNVNNWVTIKQSSSDLINSNSKGFYLFIARPS